MKSLPLAILAASLLLAEDPAPLTPTGAELRRQLDKSWEAVKNSRPEDAPVSLPLADRLALIHASETARQQHLDLKATGYRQRVKHLGDGVKRLSTTAQDLEQPNIQRQLKWIREEKKRLAEGGLIAGAEGGPAAVAEAVMAKAELKSLEQIEKLLEESSKKTALTNEQIETLTRQRLAAARDLQPLMQAFAHLAGLAGLEMPLWKKHHAELRADAKKREPPVVHGQEEEEWPQ